MSAGGRLHRFGPLVAGTLLRRRNRFVADVALDAGARAAAHLPNTGRLPELMVPGRRVLLRAAPEGSERATPFTLALVESPPPRPCWISLETPLANRLFAAALGAGLLPALAGERVVRAEQTVGASRFDFLLVDAGGRERLVEVKSANLFVDGEARFPDAPTERGRKHLTELAEHARRGGRAAVAFVLMGGRASVVRPNLATDPEFARLLGRAREAGVVLLGLRFRFDPSGARFDAVVPVEA